MKKIFVYLVYETMQAWVYELLDNDVVDMVTEWQLLIIAEETFRVLGETLLILPRQIEMCCTLWLEYTLKEFVNAVMRSIAEEDNELFERVEQREV